MHSNYDTVIGIRVCCFSLFATLLRPRKLPIHSVFVRFCMPASLFCSNPLDIIVLTFHNPSFMCLIAAAALHRSPPASPGQRRETVVPGLASRGGVSARQSTARTPLWYEDSRHRTTTAHNFLYGEAESGQVPSSPHWLAYPVALGTSCAACPGSPY